jgi:predicted nucleic acid-binding protein
MGKRYLIDSNAAVDFLGGLLPENGKQFMLKIQPEISIITCIEIQSKKDTPESEKLKYRAFAKASIVYSEISEDIAAQTISIRKKYGLKTPDAIIAATAIVKKLTLISRNEKDFIKVHKLDLINPWKI